jgi:hypothetical protein
MWATGKLILVILESLLLSAHACFLWGGSSGTGRILLQCDVFEAIPFDQFFPMKFSGIYFQLTLSLIMRDGCSWLMSDSQLIWRLSTFHKDTHLIFILLWLFTYSRWNKSWESNLFQSHEMIPFFCFTSNTSLIKMQCNKYLYNIFHWTITE